MLVIAGYLIVLGSVLGGFALSGGKITTLYQPVEFMIIFGAALGAFVCGNNGKTLMATFKMLPTVFSRSSYTKSLYLELLSLMFDLLRKARAEGMLAIEKDIESPRSSAIFRKYPNIAKDEHMVTFITDSLRLAMSGSFEVYQIENLLDEDIDTHHQEGEAVVFCIAKVGDGMPAFGIVASVVGVIHTMGSIGAPAAQLGHLIAAALVGTFLGVLLAYGFIGPLSGVLDQKLHESTKMLQCIKITLIASLQGYRPALAVEFGRRVLFSSERPSFIELESHVKKSERKR